MISVIMLTYNREHLLENMIRDVLNQQYRTFEFIIIDNGSTDKTSQLLKKYSDVDSRIKIFRMEKPVSIGCARNIGLSKAKGEYVTFVDDDDRLEADYLSFLYNLLIENDADISICGCTEGDGISRHPQCIYHEKMIINGEEAVKLLINRKYIRAGMPTKLYKKTLLDRYPFEEKVQNEDIHTQYKYLLCAKKIAMQGEDKYYILRHDGNISGFTSDASKWNSRILSDYLTAYRNRTEFVRQNAPNIYQLAQYSQWAFMLSMINKIQQYNLSDCEELLHLLKKEIFVHKEEILNSQYIKDFELQWMEMYIKNG